MAISILNLMTIPYLNFYERHQEWKLLQYVISLQIVIMMIFLWDYIIMLLIFGFHELLFKRSWALRLEFIVQIGNIVSMPTYLNVY